MRKLSAGKAVRVGEWEIIPIELSHAASELTGAGLAAFAKKEPVAIVIRSPDGEWTLDLDGNIDLLADLREVEGFE